MTMLITNENIISTSLLKIWWLFSIFNNSYSIKI